MLIVPRNIGFLHYWSLGNIPLFLLATPVLTLLFTSAFWACGWYSTPAFSPRDNRRTSIQTNKVPQSLAKTVNPNVTEFHEPPDAVKESVWWSPFATSDGPRTGKLLRQFAGPQLILAILDLTTSHVQIVSRISSGYAVWYWWMAAMIFWDSPLTRKTGVWSTAIAPRTLITFSIMYAIIQGGLYASFLPPA